MPNLLLLPELRELLTERDDKTLAEVLADLHPATIADFSEGLSVEETWQLLDEPPSTGRPRSSRSSTCDKQVEMVSGVGRERMSKLLEAMSPDDRVDLLKRLDTEVVESLMPLVTKAERQDIRTLLSFPEGRRRFGDDDRVRLAPRRRDVERGHRLAAATGPLAGDHLLHLRRWTRPVI